MNKSMQFSMLIDQETKAVMQKNEQLRKQLTHLSIENGRLFNTCQQNQKLIKQLRTQNVTNVFKLSNKIVLLQDRLDQVDEIKQKCTTLEDELTQERKKRTQLEKRIQSLEHPINQDSNSNHMFKEDNQKIPNIAQQVSSQSQNQQNTSKQNNPTYVQLHAKLKDLQHQLQQTKTQLSSTISQLQKQKQLYTSLSTQKSNSTQMTNTSGLNSLSQGFMSLSKTSEGPNYDSMRLSSELSESRSKEGALQEALKKLQNDLNEVNMKKAELKVENEKLLKENDKLTQLKKECLVTIEKLRGKKMFKEEKTLKVQPIRKSLDSK